MKKISLVILLVTITFGVCAQENELDSQLLYSYTIFGNTDDRPLQVYSDTGWERLSTAYLADLKDIEPPQDGYVRKWKVNTLFYDNSASSSSLQVKLEAEKGDICTFTLPWAENGKVWRDETSNWFIPDSIDYENLYDAFCSVRLVSEETHKITGKIYKVELEAWDIQEHKIVLSENKPRINMAAAEPLQDLSLFGTYASHEEEEVKTESHSREEARQFALDYLNACFTGTLNDFYRSLDDKIFSLDTGLAHSKYRIPPPAGEEDSTLLDKYLEKYEVRVYTLSEYEELFPEWFASDRRWIPDDSYYLFMGNELKENQWPIDAYSQYFVFMVSFKNGKWKLVAQPE